MQDNARKLTDGAMMIAILIILAAVSVYVPLLGTATMLFVPLPVMLYRLRYDRGASILILTAGIILSALGGILLIPVTLTFGLLGLIIGDTIQRKKTKLYTFMAAGLTFLMTTMMLYVLSTILFGINIIEKLTKGMYDAQKQMMTTLEKVGDVPEKMIQQMNELIEYTVLSIPSAFILSCFMFAILILWINLPIAKRLGHDIPKFPPFRLMKLPVLTVWVYMLIILLPFMMTMTPGSTAELAYVNGTLILRFLFLLQGISFIQHMMHDMKVQKWLTILCSIIALLFSPLTVILGILDTGVNIRAWVGKNKSK